MLLFLLVCLLVLVGGCAKRGKIANQAVSQLPIEGQRYSFTNFESNALLKKEIIQWAESISSLGHKISPYFIELNFEDLENPEDRLFLNSIPTSFSLESAQSDKLIATAKLLLRQNPDYQKLLIDLDANRLISDQN
jgi:hypothetical protein